MTVNNTVNLVNLSIDEIEQILSSVTEGKGIKITNFKNSAHVEKELDQKKGYIALLYNEFNTQKICLESDGVSELYNIKELATALYEAVN